jgi:hypothetical protein
MREVKGRGRQLGGAGGGPRALGAEQGRDDPQRYPPFELLGGLGVPPRREGGLLGKATLAYHQLEGLLPRGRRERRLLGPGGA